MEINIFGPGCDGHEIPSVVVDHLFNLGFVNVTE